MIKDNNFEAGEMLLSECQLVQLSDGIFLVTFLTNFHLIKCLPSLFKLLPGCIFQL